MEDGYSPIDRGAGRYPDLARVVALARRWWLPLLAAVVAAGALAAAGGAHGATYEAKTRLLVGPLDGDSKTLRAAGAQAQTFSQLVTSQVVLDGAQRELGQHAPGSALLAAVRVDAAETTRIVTITARAGSATAAAARANAVADQVLHVVGARRPPGADAPMRVIDSAEPPTAAVGSGLGTLVAMAAIAALLAGIAVALLFDYFRGRIITADELAEVTGVPTLGTVGDRTPGARRRDASIYRQLAGRVAFFGPDRRRITLVVAGPGSGAGSGRVAAGIAEALAADGRQVVLADADPAGTEVTRQFSLEGRDGLGELLDQPLHGRSSIRLARLCAEPVPRLRVVPLGHFSDEIGLAPERSARALRRLARAGDVVVLSAGASASAAALQWGTLVDGVLLVARRGDTSREETARAVEALDQVGASLLGTVLAERAQRRPWRSIATAARRRVSRRGADRESAPQPDRPAARLKGYAMGRQT